MSASSFSPMKTMVKRELANYFLTPLGYVFVVIFLFAIGYITFEPGKGSFFLMRQADLQSFFRYIPWLFLFLVPAVSMRLWADERKSGTIELLLTLPLSVSQAVWAKFFAAWIFIIFSLLATFPLIITVAFLGDPDWGPLILGYVGSMFLGAIYLAIGNFFSAATKNQVVSFILSVVFCYLLMNAASPPILNFLSGVAPMYVVELFESLSLLNHFESMGRGVIRLSDIWFYLVMILGWVSGSILLLQKNKAR